MKDTALLAAAIIFLIVSLMHLARLIFKIDIKVNRFTLPMGLSVFGFLFALALGLWMLAAMK